MWIRKLRNWDLKFWATSWKNERIFQFFYCSYFDCLKEKKTNILFGRFFRVFKNFTSRKTICSNLWYQFQVSKGEKSTFPTLELQQVKKKISDKKSWNIFDFYQKKLSKNQKFFKIFLLSFLNFWGRKKKKNEDHEV